MGKSLLYCFLDSQYLVFDIPDDHTADTHARTHARTLDLVIARQDTTIDGVHFATPISDHSSYLFSKGKETEGMGKRLK